MPWMQGFNQDVAVQMSMVAYHVRDALADTLHV